MELAPDESIIGSRQRRPNAGSRLKVLLQMQEPLEDENDIFAEVEDDQEFDINDDEKSSAAESASDGEESQEDVEQSERAGQSESATEPGHPKVAEDDDNFSDSSDSSIENDEEEADAGEQALEKERREARRAQKRAEKQNLFTIKQRRPAKQAKKEAHFPKADTLLAGDRRVSKRASAVRMKERVIERLRENERRKAEYVPPTIKKKPKLTQEQRLEEAQITERKNTASLHHFVQIEEYRKQQRRIALLGRRPKLQEFVRWHSTALYDYPMVQEVDTKDTRTEELAVRMDGVGTNETSGAAGDKDSGAEATQDVGQDTEMPDEPLGDSSQSVEPQQSVEPSQSEGPEGSRDPSPSLQEPNETAGTVPTESDQNSNAKQEADVASNGSALTAEDEGQRDPESKAIADKIEAAKDAALNKPLLDIFDEDAEEEEPEPEIREVEGPPTVKNVAILTFHDFFEPINNKQTVRKTVFGPSAKITPPPAKRLCPVTGQEAKYLDPSTGVSYRSLEVSKLLRRIKNQELPWSVSLGAFLRPPSETRHAKGVPEGFYAPLRGSPPTVKEELVVPQVSPGAEVPGERSTEPMESMEPMKSTEPMESMEPMKSTEPMESTEPRKEP